MENAELRQGRARAIITSVCAVLRAARANTTVFVRDLTTPGADLTVVLQDATRMFCEAVSERHGENPICRWSPEWVESLLAHPEHCEDTLVRIENCLAPLAEHSITA